MGRRSSIHEKRFQIRNGAGRAHSYLFHACSTFVASWSRLMVELAVGEYRSCDFVHYPRFRLQPFKSRINERSEQNVAKYATMNRADDNFLIRTWPDTLKNNNIRYSGWIPEGQMINDSIHTLITSNAFITPVEVILDWRQVRYAEADVLLTRWSKISSSTNGA